MTSTAHSRNKQVKDAIANIAGGAGASEPTHENKRALSETWGRIAAPLASLKLTVILFSLGLFLVFAGTLALKHFGLWTAMKLYFRTFLAWIDIAIFFPESAGVPQGKIHFPFPGGWTIGFAMLFNLLAAHSIRFQVKAVGNARLWGWIGMVAGHVVLGFGLYLTVVSQPQITQGWWEATGRVEGVSATFMGSGIILWASIVLFAKRAGIFLTHAGIILLLVGELLTGLLAVESQMRIAEGETVNYASNIERSELAFVYRDKTGKDQAVVVPASLLRPGETLDDKRLPFKIKTEKYFKNSKLVLAVAPPEARNASGKAFQRNTEVDAAFQLTAQELADSEAIRRGQVVTPELQERMLAFFKNAKPDFDSAEWRNQMKAWIQWHAYGGYDGREWIMDVAASEKETKANIGALADLYLLRELPETKGTDATNPDFAGAFITLIDRGSGPVGTYLLHLFDDEGQIAMEGDKKYRVFLRFERYYKPYAIYAKDVRADKFTGSITPRNYSTQLIRYDEEHKAGEEVIIRMNEPMRFSGETFYQSQVAAVRKTRADGTTFVDEAGATVLQVVSNPGYLMPYIACIVVSAGLFVHFGITLTNYVRKQMK